MSDQLGDAGLLTASEIADMNLHASFVALSACNTANFDFDRIAQDLPALASAFAVSGVPATLGTLWPVDSRTGQAVVADVFARLRETAAGPADALARAQRAFLAAPPGRAYLHPRFWAPFVGGPGGHLPFRFTTSGSFAMTSRRLALVTGASAGIGEAFARLLAARGYDLALTARRAERLQALAAELGAAHAIQALALPADLARLDGARTVLEELAAAGRSVDVLVNNAGYGLPGGYARTRWADQQAFLQVMVTAPCELAHAVLPGMVERRFGRIVNVASVAGLLPGAAGHTLYAGAKSLMIRFSESLHLEAAPHGVHVTALCPGFTLTEFHDVNATRARVTAATPRWAWSQAAPVAEAGWRAAEANRPICVTGFAYQAICALARLVPESLALAIMRAQGPRFREL